MDVKNIVKVAMNIPKNQSRRIYGGHQWFLAQGVPNHLSTEKWRDVGQTIPQLVVHNAAGFTQWVGVSRYVIIHGHECHQITMQLVGVHFSLKEGHVLVFWRWHQELLGIASRAS